VYGDYGRYAGTHGIETVISEIDLNNLSESNVYEVDCETIGQYTELNDKNGKKIFEGDILKIYPDCDYSEDYGISKVYSYNGIPCVDYRGDDFDSTALGFINDYNCDAAFEVIGNIHDNPELLEV
jgi:uncharacterized phage protein (TIGR01671 family)